MRMRSGLSVSSRMLAVNFMQKAICKFFDVFALVKMLAYVPSSSFSDGSQVLVQADALDLTQKIFHAPGFIEKSRDAIADQFGYARNSWREHGFAAAHGIHERERNALTLAR